MTGVTDLTDPGIPSNYALSIFPNPFNSRTVVQVDVPITGEVEVILLDLSGRHIRTLSLGLMPTGRHELAVEAGELPNGIYMVSAQGEGVILTSDEVLNGTVGIKSDTNADVINKFLKVYPSLDGIQLTHSQLEQVEQKLSLDDGQFDSWLQSKLPDFLGRDEVNETLNNDMFDTFEPMGGEEVEESAQLDFDDFLDTVQEEGEVPTEESEEEEAITRKEAELDIGGIKLDEFTNI